MTSHGSSSAICRESTVLASLTNKMLLTALQQLPVEQQDCLVMRFLQGMSIAETAAVLQRSEGARGMEEAPWALIFPASFLAATLFCFNFIGDGLRDALDPRLGRG